uniref:Golgin subfamily A conserved domain-containing protein n=1 Tax=Ditylenchus dipsaci TaxID=166011 RepID=A0A915EJV4_9BILA
MSEVDDRLSHAKKLLKKYQSKYQQDLKVDHYNGYQHPSDATDHEHPCNTSIDPEIISCAPSRNSSCPSSTCNDNKVMPKGLLTPESSPSSENAEIAYLRKTLSEKDQSLNETANKLQLLHTHYSELYETYNLVNQSVQSNSIGGDQVSQLQTALAVAIEEKTGLQFELRDLSSKLASSETENRALKESQKIRTVALPSSDSSEQLKQLANEKSRLMETISNQSAQIEKQRKECSNLEAKIMVIQQDRNETQARLKHLYEEKNTLENDIEQMRNDLNMKEIYIRQLTRYSQADPQDQLVIQSLTEERKRCVEEAELKSAEVMELKKQAAAAREHFESCLSGVNDKLSRLQVEAEELRTSKAELESAKSYLEEQLRLLRINLEKTENFQTGFHNGQSPNPKQSETKVDLAEYEALQNSLSSMEQEYARNCSKYKELEKRVEQKNSQIESLQYELSESQRKIAALEEAGNVKSSIDVDVSSLLEQLQNEKATVSRAVGQNLELKEQLKELQDKFIAITNESATKEIERTSALANLAALQHQITDMQKTLTSQPSEENVSSIEHIKSHNFVERECQTDFTDVKISEELNGGTEHTENNVHNHLPETYPSQLNAAVSEESSHRCAPETPLRASPQEECSQISKQRDNLENGTPPQSNGQRSHNSTPSSMLNEATLRQLEQQLEKALTENSQFRISNERLQHWLTALETENESIGEYVALYRYQRSNIQKKIVESEMAIKRSRAEYSAVLKQLTDLQSAVISFARKKVQPVCAQQSLPRNLEEVVESSVTEMSSLIGENSVDVKEVVSNGSDAEVASRSSLPDYHSETLEKIIEIISRQQENLPKDMHAYLIHTLM